MNWTVLGAIFKRDFVSYFSNPTGYVFICLFVMMSAAAAFWPPAFFNNNLANLDQLSTYFPWIMLVFIPAITMSTWAEERRQGTDELLLTMPATDFDVVMGKYLAALAIYTVSLLFSMFSVFLVFSYGLGQPDWGLFACTYFGYWLVGGALLSIGMVASFLTRNLTVGFIVGLLFLAPFAVAGVADWIVKDPATAQLISRWSVAEQFRDFQRGVISFSGISYFVSLALVMLYLCMVLIGRRHWGTGDEGDNRWAHYFGRFVALLLIAGGLNVVVSNYDRWQYDATAEKINSLSPNTKKLLATLAKDDEVKPITVDAYVSPVVPSEYAAHKLDLLGTLREFETRSGGKVQTNIYEIETFSPQAQTASQSYGIEPREVRTTRRGRPIDEEIFMGLAITSGLDKVVVPFVDKGIPPEYEVLRSIMTVADAKRKRVGVVDTGVNLFGEFSMQGPPVKSQIIVELEKQYDVVRVDPNEPITEEYDVLLAVQPSMLSPPAMINFVECIRRGQSVAIFEDPSPNLWPGAVGTAEPNRAGGGPMAMFGGGQEIPKGDLRPLWNLLGVRLIGESTSLFGPSEIDVILQDFNPYYMYDTLFNIQFVFIDESLGADGDVEPFNAENPIAAGLRQLLFLRPGALLQDDSSQLTHQAICSTGKLTWTVGYSNLQRIDFRMRVTLEDREKSDESYVMAFAIEGEVESLDALSQDPATTGDGSQDDVPLETSPIKAVVVADIDCLGDAFFAIRAQGEMGDDTPDFTFQNVAFVLNTLDWLADDDRYIPIRKRTRAHRILTKIKEETDEYRIAFRENEEELEKQASELSEEIEKELTEARDRIEARNDLDPREKEFLLAQVERRIGSKVRRKVAELDRNRDRDIRQARNTLQQQINGVQNYYKQLALLVPPIPPILLGLFVFFHRRNREREGVSKRRLRFVSESSDEKQDTAA